MIRTTLLCAAMVCLAQVLPPGCSLSASNTPPVTPERQIITTQATAPATANVGDTVTMSATATADVDGGGVSYSWLQTGGPGVTIVDATQYAASFVAPSLATDQVLKFLVTTSNERGDAGRAEVGITVAADPNYGATASQPSSNVNPPVARVGPDREVAGAASVALDASASTGDTLTYAWTQTSGTSVTLKSARQARAEFTAPAYVPGDTNQLEFQVTITDSRGRHSTDSIMITILPPNPSDDPDQTPNFKIATTLGEIVVELDRTKAPISTNNFQQYVQDKFYDGTLFHRVIPDFVIQGGGFEPGLVQKQTRDPITNESNNGLSNLLGTIAMARTTDPNSATSQFYINLKDNTQLDYQDGQEGYAVFGHVVSGMDVANAIANVPTQSTQGFDNVPVTDVVITSITRVAKTGQ